MGREKEDGWKVWELQMSGSESAQQTEVELRKSSS